MKKALVRRAVSLFLCFCMVIGFVPIIDAQAAEIKGGTFDPHTGHLELEFGYQLTQYVNINVYVRSPSDDGLKKEFVGSIVENYLLSGANDVKAWIPEDSPDTMVSPYTPTTKEDGGLVELSEDGIYQADKNFAGEDIEPVSMMKHTLIWDGSLDGIPIIGPNLDEDVFYLTVEIEPLGRPDKNVLCTDSEDSHTHGQNYTWPQKQENGKKKFAVSTELLVDYRDYVVGEDGTAAFLMLEGSLSDEVRKKLYEQFVSGSLACKDLTGFPELEGLVLDYQNLDPVNMVTGAYNFMYEDLKMEGVIPLTFLRVYNSRYNKGALGTGFTHSYDYSLINDRGIIRVTMPGGEEQIFLTLRNGGYDSLADSGFVLENEADGGYRMTHEDGAAFIFSNDGKLQTIYNPDGTQVARLTYNGDELTEINGIAGSYTLAWSNGHISSVTDNAGRTVSYEHVDDFLTGVTNADGDTLHYTYDGNGYLNTATDFEDEVYIENEYDGVGRVVKQTFINADIPTVSTVSYDDDARVTTCVDANGLETRYYYDNHRNIQKVGTVIDGTEYTTTNTYDGDYRANSASDRLNGATAYEYDSNGNVTKVRYADNTAMTLTYTAGGDIASITDALGYTETYTYSGHSLTEFRDKNGHTTSYTYNALGLPITVTDALGNQTTYVYDDKGRQLSVTDAEGGVVSFEYDAVGRIVAEHTKVSDTATATTKHTYSKAGKLLKTVDALGGETSYEYNANGFTTSTKDALGGTVTTEYGTNGEPLKRTDANGNETTYEYDKDTAQLVSVTDAEGNETRYTYNDRGLLIQTTDAEGNATTYEYDALDRVAKTIDALDGETIYAYDSMGRTVSETDAEGNKKTYTYDALGRTKTETDGAGNKTTYTYDPVGNLLVTTDANGNETKTEYNAINAAVKQIDGEGNETTYTYDKAGRLLTETDALGGVTAYTYDLAGNKLSVTDPEGNVTKYIYDLLGRAVEQINADGSKTRTVYDALGRTTESYDELGGKTVTTYDANGNQLTVTDPKGNKTSYQYNRKDQITVITYADGGETRYTYNALGNVSEVIDQNGNATRYAYDALGRTHTETNAVGVVTEYGYDKVGNTVSVTKDGTVIAKSEYDGAYRVVKAIDGLGNAGTKQYDGVGNVLVSTDREGNATQYTYDKNYNLLKTTDAEGGVSSSAYDALGRVVSETDENGSATTYTYDKNGNVLTETDALSGVVTNTYDARGRVAATTDKLGATTAYTYDAAGNLRKETDANNAYAVYQYDANNNLIQYTNRNNEWVKYAYDCMNRQVKETNQLNHATEYEYDLAGNQTAVIDGNKNKTVYNYDGLNRLVSKTNAEGGMFEYRYDSFGNTAGTTMYGGGDEKATTTYTYDAAGNLLTETSPLGSVTTYTHDKEGNVLTQVDENGKQTAYTYDKLYRTVSRKDADGTATFTYDKAGNMTSAKDGNSTVAFAFDALSRTTKVTNEDSTTTAYAYDAASNRLSITYPDGKAVTTAYDILGNVKSQTDHDGTGITYTRDAEGRTIKEGHSDGSTTEYDYNAAGLLTLQKEVTKSNSTRRQTAYTYDDAGNIVSENRSGVDIDKKDELVRYYYDKANQLIRTNVEGKNTKYSYDLAGNLLSDGTNTYTYDLQNRLTSKTGKDGTTTYTYDAAGNLIKKAAPDGTTEYTYTAQNKLKTGKTEDGQSSTYTYNALNARIKNVQVRDNKNAGHANSDLKDGSHGTDYLDFLMDGRFFWQRTWETEVGTTFQSNFETVTKNYVVDYLSTANRDILVTEDGSFTQRYVYDENSTRISAEYGYAVGTKRGEGGENLQSDFAANDVRKVWYRASHLGSTLFAVDENSKVISHTIYDPWGNPLTETYTDTNFSGIDNSNNYTGYTWDEVLDLYFAQNRFYDPADHRFTQEDPIKDGENWYAYCGNNAIAERDMYGFAKGLRFVHHDRSEIRFSANETIDNIIFTVNKNTVVTYEDISVRRGNVKWAKVSYKSKYGWIKADNLGVSPINLPTAKIDMPASYLPAKPAQVQQSGSTYSLYVPTIVNGANTSTTPAGYGKGTEKRTSWLETNWAAVGMLALDSGADVGDVLPSGSAPGMSMIMGAQIIRSIYDNSTRVYLTSIAYNSTSMGNKLVLILGFDLAKRTEYAGSYFCYSYCFSPTGTYSQSNIQKQIAQANGLSKYTYADFKVCVDLYWKNSNDWFYIALDNGHMRVYPIKAKGDSRSVIYKNGKQWSTAFDYNYQYKQAYTVPTTLQSKIRNHATTDLAITNL
ncbi:MAG: DUF6531 domain-containing protein [Butyricicoccaceae bacterium]